MKSNRICFVVRSFKGGGAQRVMLRLANGFVDKGYDVSIVVFNGSGAFSTEVDGRIKIFDMGCSKTIRCIPRIVRYINEYEPEVIFSTEAAINIALVVCIGLSSRSPKLIVREGLAPSKGKTESSSFSTKLSYYIVPLFYNFTDLVVALTDKIKIDLIENFSVKSSKVCVIPYNPVVSPGIWEAANEALADDWYIDDVAKGKKKFLLAVGRHERQKGFSTLIEAFSRAQAVIPSILVIVGEGRETVALKNIVEKLRLDNVLFLPFTSNPFKYMSRCDLFVMSSIYEGLPNTLIEALACGATVLSTDCETGPKEILDDGKYGFLTPVNDVEAMAKNIIKILSSNLPIMHSKERARLYTVDHSVSVYEQAMLSLF